MMRRMIHYAGTLGCLVMSFYSSAQTGTLQRQIEQAIASVQADVGVAVRGIENKDEVMVNNNRPYPLQSVFKFHIALAVLHQVDKGKLRLTQEIPIKRSELLPGTWSPMREAYPSGDIRLPLSQIIQYTVAQSDNNGCEILLRLLGGTAAVNRYIHSLGIKDVAIQATEEEMRRAWDVQFTNQTTPRAATNLLFLFYRKKILSENSFRFLWTIMEETATGKDRIKGLLPAGTKVAHKTGTSDTNPEGITAAINDIGIVTLPNGKHFAIAVFVSNSKENTATNEHLIARVSKLALGLLYK
jgi:beta-lactamase class A